MICDIELVISAVVSERFKDWNIFEGVVSVKFWCMPQGTYIYPKGGIYFWEHLSIFANGVYQKDIRTIDLNQIPKILILFYLREAFNKYFSIIFFWRTEQRRKKVRRGKFCVGSSGNTVKILSPGDEANTDITTFIMELPLTTAPDCEIQSVI